MTCILFFLQESDHSSGDPTIGESIPPFIDDPTPLMILSPTQEVPIPPDPFREEGHQAGDSSSSTTKEASEEGAIDQPQ